MPTLYFGIEKIAKQYSCNAKSLSKGFTKIRLVSETSFFSSLEFWSERVGGKGYTNIHSAQKTETQGIFSELLLVIHNSRGRQLARNDS